MMIFVSFQSLVLVFVLALNFCWISAFNAQLVPQAQAGLSYWYPYSYAPIDLGGGGGGYQSGGYEYGGDYPAISSPYQYNTYQYPAYLYCCYSGAYPQVPPKPVTTTPPPPMRPFTIFARHSLTTEETDCPIGTELKWSGYSFSQIAYGDKQDGPGEDLGSYRSCYRNITTLIPYLRQNYTAYWLNSNVEPTVHGGYGYGSTRSDALTLYDFSPYASRCVTCHVKAQVKTLHSFTDAYPTCPFGWRRLWNGFSYAQGQTDPVTSKEAYKKALVSPGSCLEKFRAKLFIKCPGQGHCTPFSSAYGYWIPAAGNHHTISKCTVCMTQSIGKPNSTEAPTTKSTDRPARPPSSSPTTPTPTHTPTEDEPPTPTPTPTEGEPSSTTAKAVNVTTIATPSPSTSPPTTTTTEAITTAPTPTTSRTIITTESSTAPTTPVSITVTTPITTTTRERPPPVPDCGEANCGTIRPASA